jgi:hypothetical protein
VDFQLDLQIVGPDLQDCGVLTFGGNKSNAFLVFDYQSPTDFKFAGIDISTNKLHMGRRTATGWQVDVQTPAQLKSDRDYNVLLAINGVTPPSSSIMRWCSITPSPRESMPTDSPTA